MTDNFTVMCSGAFVHALDRVSAQFRSEIGCPIVVVGGPSIGKSPRALPVRIRAGEASDLVILFAAAVDALVDDGLILPGTKTAIAASGIGVAVREGAPRADVSSPGALRQALLDARCFAYSASASGVYVSGELIRKLGLPEEVMRKGRRVECEAVGAVLARGEADLGFQQMSELVPLDGITVLGSLPEALQRTTVLSAALPANVRNASTARSLVACLVSVAAHTILIDAGLRPAEASDG